jgi:hypothetical protein
MFSGTGPSGAASANTRGHRETRCGHTGKQGKMTRRSYSEVRSFGPAGLRFGCPTWAGLAGLRFGCPNPSSWSLLRILRATKLSARSMSSALWFCSQMQSIGGDPNPYGSRAGVERGEGQVKHERVA